MDVRTPPRNYEEARLEAEIAVTDELRRQVVRIPRAHPELTPRDIALGLVIRTYAAPDAEGRRKLLSLFREAERTTDPEVEADLYEQMEMLCYGWKRAAEERRDECDPITGARVQP